MFTALCLRRARIPSTVDLFIFYGHFYRIEVSYYLLLDLQKYISHIVGVAFVPRA